MKAPALNQLDEWNLACTIEKCSEESARHLADYARNVFSRYLITEQGNQENPDLQLHVQRCLAEVEQQEPRVCWHLLEHRLNAGTHRNGKHYKSWLFEHGIQKPTDSYRLAALLSGLRLMIQAVVRDYCAGEIARQKQIRAHGVTSLDGVNAAGDPLMDYYMQQAENLLNPTPDQEAHAALLREDAAVAADRLFQDMEPRWKVVIFVKYTEQNLPDQPIISLDHPAVIRAAGCGKSQLYAARREFSMFLDERINAATSLDDPQSLSEWKLAVACALIERIYLWMQSEKSCSPLLEYLKHYEERDHE